jgi:hypothetical protein
VLSFRVGGDVGLKANAKTTPLTNAIFATLSAPSFTEKPAIMEGFQKYYLPDRLKIPALRQFTNLRKLLWKVYVYPFNSQENHS